MISPALGVYEYRAAREIARVKHYRESGCDIMANHVEIVADRFTRLVETTKRWAVMEHIAHSERPGRATYDPYNNVHPMVAPPAPNSCDTQRTHRTHNPENIGQG